MARVEAEFEDLIEILLLIDERMIFMSDVVSIIIFIGCVILFIIDKLPMATTAILGCVLMVMFGVCDFSTAFGQFSSSTVILTIGVMVIGAAISETGLAALIGRGIIKISRGKTSLIIFTYITSSIMSAFLTNSAVLAIFIPIIMGLSKADDSLNSKEIIMPITLGCILGGASTLAGSTQQLVTQGMLEAAGERTFGMFDLSLIGGIIILVGLIYCLTVGKYVGRKLWGGLAEEENAVEVMLVPTEYEKKRVVIISIIFGLAVVSYITEWIPLAATSTIAAVACIITGCITQKRAIESINWNIVGRFGGYLGMAKALEVAGGSELITRFFDRVIGDSLTPFMLLCIVVLLTKLISEFMSPSAALLIVLPLVFSVVEKLGLNTYAYALAATFASSTALMTPLASTTLGMSMSVGYKFNDYFKYYITFDIVTFFLLIFAVPVIYGLTV